MTGVAVKVTELPWQNGLTEADIVILTARFGLTVIVTVFDVAGLPLAQAAFEVRIQVTRSPLTGM